MSRKRPALGQGSIYQRNRWWWRNHVAGGVRRSEFHDLRRTAVRNLRRAGVRGENPRPGGVGTAFSITISADGAVIRNDVVEDAPPERYSLPELRAALETWSEAIERVRRSTDPTALP